MHLTNTYDSADRITRQTLADGGYYQFAYTLDGNGKITQTDVTDPLGRRTAYTYDAQGNRSSVTALSGTANAVTDSYTYEAAYSQLASHTDPLGHVAAFAHDSQGNLTE